MPRRGSLLLAGLLLFAPGQAALAQPIVVSPAPEDVDVTLYRAPGRPPEAAMELRWLEGYALVSETRRVAIPAGESRIRFEGVAGGILPQSAIVTGFPDGVVERNHDAYLLSPSTLLDRSLGRRVHLRRTSHATGEVREQEAVIRSGAGGAVVLQTAEGYEALRCTGISETLVYDEIPPELSARPTLSVLARSREPVTASVTLSYLASGFDWQANYVARLSPDGRSLALFAWLTLASSDETSFVDADAQAVAGRLNREEVAVEPAAGGPIELRCWPQGSASDPLIQPPAVRAARARLGAARGEAAAEADESIVVSGMRASQEDLGDLKLYRIPEPVTVAANSQKQVAFLDRPHVEVESVYRQRLDPRHVDEIEWSTHLLVTRNRREEGLGIPLPGGRLQLFGESAGRAILLGESPIRDMAVGEDVEILVGEAPGVRSRVELVEQGDGWRDYRITITSDRRFPIIHEVEFVLAEGGGFRPRARLSRRNGRPLWVATVPANGTASLHYRVSR